MDSSTSQLPPKPPACKGVVVKCKSKPTTATPSGEEKNANNGLKQDSVAAASGTNNRGTSIAAALVFGISSPLQKTSTEIPSPDPQEDSSSSGTGNVVFQINSPQKIERRKLVGSVARGVPIDKTQSTETGEDSHRLIDLSTNSGRLRRSESLTKGRIFNWGENRQRSLSNILSFRRKDQQIEKCPSPTSEKEPPFFVKLSRTSSVPLVDSDSVIPGVLKRTRKNSKNLSVHFPDEHVLDLKNTANDTDSFKTIEKIDLRKFSSAKSHNSLSLSSKDFVRQSIDLEEISDQTATRKAYKTYRRSLSITIPSLTKNLAERRNSLFNKEAQEPQLPAVNFDEKFNQSKSQVTRIGGVRSIYSIPSENLPKVVQKLEKIDPSHSESKATEELSLHRRYSSSAPQNLPEPKVIEVREVHCSTAPVLIQNRRQSFHVFTSDIKSSERTTFPRTSELLDPSNSVPKLSSANDSHSRIVPIAESEDSTDKDSVKSSSHRSSRFFLPPVRHKALSGSEEARIRKEFLSRLPPEIAELLLIKMKGSPDCLLVTACRLVEEDQVLRLIKEMSLNSQLNVLINQRDKTGRTALSYCSVNGYTRAVVALTGIPTVELNIADSEGNTALHLAAQAGHPEVVAHLVNKCNRKVDLDARNALGFTPLMKAALQGRTKIAKTLLFAGASPHLRDFGRGFSAVEWARFTGRHLCCDLIESVERSCSSQIKDSWGSDPDHKGGAVADTRDSWLKHKFKKAFTKSESKKEFSVASNLSNLAVCATTPLLPNPVQHESNKTNVIPTLQVTEVKVSDCYEDPEENLLKQQKPPSKSAPVKTVVRTQSSPTPIVSSPPPSSTSSSDSKVISRNNSFTSTSMTKQGTKKHQHDSSSHKKQQQAVGPLASAIVCSKSTPVYSKVQTKISEETEEDDDTDHNMK